MSIDRGKASNMDQVEIWTTAVLDNTEDSSSLSPFSITVLFSPCCWVKMGRTSRKEKAIGGLRSEHIFVLSSFVKNFRLKNIIVIKGNIVASWYWNSVHKTL